MLNKIHIVEGKKWSTKIIHCPLQSCTNKYPCIHWTSVKVITSQPECDTSWKFSYFSSLLNFLALILLEFTVSHIHCNHLIMQFAFPKNHKLNETRDHIFPLPVHISESSIYLIIPYLLVENQVLTAMMIKITLSILKDVLFK